MKFPQMHEILSPSKQGVAEINHYEITKLQAAMSTVRGIITRPGKVCVLYVDGQTMMSDTEHERETNREVVRNARGDVLVGGLGLGMILHAILPDPDVSSVTVVEKYQDVIDLVVPTLPQAEKLEVVCEDILTWKPPKDQTWDTIYFDIWPDICEDNLDEMAKLHRRFGRRKRPGGWMDSWCRSKLLRMRRRERQSSYW